MSAVEGNRSQISVDHPAEANTKHISKALEHDQDGIVRQSKRSPIDLAVTQFNQHADQVQKPEKSMLENTSGRSKDGIQIAHHQDQSSKIRAHSSSSPTTLHQERSSAAKAQPKPPTPPVRNTQAMTVAALIKTV